MEEKEDEEEEKKIRYLSVVEDNLQSSLWIRWLIPKSVVGKISNSFWEENKEQKAETSLNFLSLKRFIMENIKMFSIIYLKIF
jgi:hypothetical protein